MLFVNCHISTFPYYCHVAFAIISRMCKQCVPGALSSPPPLRLGTRLGLPPTLDTLYLGCSYHCTPVTVFFPLGGGYAQSKKINNTKNVKRCRDGMPKSMQTR